MSRHLGPFSILALFAMLPACERAQLPVETVPQAQVSVSGEDLLELEAIVASVRDAVDRGDIQLPHLGDDPLAALSPAERRLLLATAARGARAHGRTLEIGCGGECIVPPADR